MITLQTLQFLGFPVESATLKDGKFTSILFASGTPIEQQIATNQYLMENDLLGTPAEPQSQPAADWGALIFALAGNTLLKFALARTSDQLALICLINEVKAPRPDFGFLKLHWDNAIAGLPEPLSIAQQQAFIILAEQKHLGLSLNPDGTLKQLHWNGQGWAESDNTEI